MSKPIDQKTLNLLRQNVIAATRKAAKGDNVSIKADALALIWQPHLMIVNSPISGIERLDFKALLDGRSVLDDTAVMYWQLSGDVFDDPKGRLQRRGTASLRDVNGKTVAKGDLSICIQPAPKKVPGSS
jgi:hypothetical protein